MKKVLLAEILNEFVWKTYKFEVGKPHPFAFFENDGNVRGILQYEEFVTIIFEKGYELHIGNDGEKVERSKWNTVNTTTSSNINKFIDQQKEIDDSLVAMKVVLVIAAFLAIMTMLAVILINKK